MRWRVAADALRSKEVDVAVVGAVGLGADVRSYAALVQGGDVPSEGAVAMVVMREDDATRQGLRVYGRIHDIGTVGPPDATAWPARASARIGLCTEVDGLAQLTYAVLALHRGVWPAADGLVPLVHSRDSPLRGPSLSPKRRRIARSCDTVRCGQYAASPGVVDGRRGPRVSLCGRGR